MTRFTKSLCLVFTALSVAALLSAGPRQDLLKEPVKTLAKASDPVEAADFLLSVGDAVSVNAYAATLLEKNPDMANVLRSRVEFAQGNVAGAVQYLEMVEKHTQVSSALKKQMAEALAAAASRTETKSDLFVLSVPKSQSFLAPYLLSALERTFADAREQYGVAIATPVRVAVYADLESFTKAAGAAAPAPEKTGVLTAVSLGRILLLSPRAVPRGYRWLDAACGAFHRLTVDRLSGGQAPQWLREGLARRGEDEWRRQGGYVPTPADMNRFAEAALVNPSTGSLLIPFEKLEPAVARFKSQDDVLLAQVESADAVEFLLKDRPKGVLGSLLKSLRAAPSVPAAFTAAIGVTDSALVEQWLKSLNGRPWVLTKGVADRAVSFADIEPPQSRDVQPVLRAGDALRKKDPAQALFQYRKALVMEPDNGLLLSRAAEACLSVDEAEAAEGYLRRAVEKNPFYAPPFALLGQLLYDAGRYDEAQRVLQEGLEIQPFQARLHETLGFISMDVGDTATARSSFQLSLELDPDNKDVRTVLKGLPKGGRR